MKNRQSVKLGHYAALVVVLGLVMLLSKQLKRSLQSAVGLEMIFSSRPEENRTLEQLLQENRSLKEELDRYKAEYAHEKWVARQIQYLKELRNREMDESKWRAFFERRAESLGRCLEMHQRGIGARVIVRDPNFWSSFLWIDVGTSNGVDKNSPVVVENALVGVVDEVESKRSKVRLLTDVQMTPSVRAVRGEQGGRYVMNLSDQLLEILRAKRGFFSSPSSEDFIVKAIENLRKDAVTGWGDHYLAKGEVCGSNLPLWRSRKLLLHGKGFNYDFPDEEGRARDLRFDRTSDGSWVPLLLPGDLLVTSGLDGVFPEGLEVGIVVKVNPLREGDSSYDLEAVPAFSHFDEIKYVWVLHN